jgi:hypothetical protein
MNICEFSKLAEERRKVLHVYFFKESKKNYKENKS